MNATAEPSLIQLLAQGGSAALLAAIIFFGGREGLKVLRELSKDIRDQSAAAAQREADRELKATERHGAVLASLGRIEARGDDRDIWEDDGNDKTPVRGLRPVRNGRRP